MFRRTHGDSPRSRACPCLSRSQPKRLAFEPLEQRTLLSAVQWTIDSAQSYTTLSIPNQNVNLPLSGGGTVSVLVQFKNQPTSQNGAWNSGNTSALSGQIDSDYVDGSSIKFLSTSSIINLDSGSYRPNAAVWDSGTSTYTDNSSAPAAFGARIRGSISILSFDVGYLAISDVQDTISSDVLSINATGDFPASTTNFGMSSGTLLFQGLTVPLLGDVPSSNAILSGTDFQSTNTLPTGSITTPDPINQPLGRRLTMPFSIPISYNSPDLSPDPLTGTISGLLVANSTLAASNSATVAGTKLFYKGSSKWDVTNGATFSDDNAIAPDKTAYLPGSGTSAFSAVSSYDKGINGLMIDLSGTHGAITANDFVFKVGNNNSPSLWTTAAAPTTVTTRAGAGAGGSDRVELLWANNAIQKTWLEAVVKGNDSLGGFNTNSGLASSYVFFFGSALGDAGVGNTGAFQTTSADEINARNNPKGIGNPATRSDVNDFNRNGFVDSADQIIARNNPTSLGNQLKFLAVGAGGPFAPEGSRVGSSDLVPTATEQTPQRDDRVSTALAASSAPPMQTAANSQAETLALASAAAVEDDRSIAAGASDGGLLACADRGPLDDESCIEDELLEELAEAIARR